MTKAFDVFLSYHRSDEVRAVQIAEALAAHGIEVWIDKENIAPGDRLVEGVESGLQNCRAVAILVSPSSLRSGWVMEEYHHALDASRSEDTRLIPVLLEPVEQVPPLMANRRWVEFCGEADFTEAVKQLVWGIRGHGADAVASPGSRQRLAGSVEGVPKEIGDADSLPTGRTHSVQPLRYSLNDKPPPVRTAFYSLQNVLTMLPATVAVPLLISSELGLRPSETARFVCAVFVSMGLATILQVKMGTRLPLVHGSSFAFVPVMALAAQSAQTPERALQYVSGAIILGSLFQFCLGATRLVGSLKRIFTPVVTAPVIVVIGLSLFELGTEKAGQHWLLASVTITLVFLLALGSEQWLKGRLQMICASLPVLITIASMTVVCWVWTAAGRATDASPLHVSLAPIAEAPWMIMPELLPWGAPVFSLTFFIAALAAYMAATVESVGDYHVCTQACDVVGPSKAQLNRGVMSQGVASAVSGLMGGVGNTVYSENIGLIAVTRVGSRNVILGSGLLMIAMGVFAKAGAIIGIIPVPVMGGLYCLLFGMIVGMGLQHAAKADLSRPRNALIMGFTVFMGLGVPVYVRNNLEGLAAMGFGLGEVVIALGSTGVAVTAVLGVLLDNILPGKRVQEAPGSLPFIPRRYPASVR